ncbi:endo-1,4-beta-xylanase [Streptosporangium sandarakinum]|uniref:endo-1,4-beta-xylanase n=1 Tax=Streptosporangium sandarakinum TaxID=1260955 RepID=UPI003D90D40D
MRRAAFRWARAAGPSAKLYINDFSVEWSTPKRAGLHNLVRDLRAQGVPIDDVGHVEPVGTRQAG